MNANDTEAPKRVRVAIVDDHTLFRKGIIEILMQLNYEVVGEASNGEEYLSLAPTIDPDVVLMDVSMPRKDGIETTRLLQRHHENQKVIALTMTDDDITIIRMIRAGAKGYLLKDVEPEELNKAISEVALNHNYYGTGLSTATIESATQVEKGGQRDDKEWLTPREMEFLKLCCSDLSYKEIAENMNIMFKTVDYHRAILFNKFGVQSRPGLVVRAIQMNLVKV